MFVMPAPIFAMSALMFVMPAKAGIQGSQQHGFPAASQWQGGEGMTDFSKLR